jgi:NADPH-dependent curcumin reductase CurA
MVEARQWTLNKRPSGLPVLEGADSTFTLSNAQVGELRDDHVLVKPVYLSNDPAQRGWLRDMADPSRLYVPPVKEGEVMRARALAEVLESSASKFKKGDLIIATTGWAEKIVLPASQCQAAPQLPNNLSATHYLGALGLTGLTAYFGLTSVARTSSEDVVVISGAAGATGSMAVQIAKKMLGAKRVIGIAGTDAKCEWVKSLGADECLNYKSPSFASDLKKATPDFANVYFDNVGGEILDLMLTRMARNGRVAACGAISNYNSSGDAITGLKNWFEVVSMRIEIKGFIVLDFADKWAEGLELFKKALADGKLTVGDEGEHIVEADFDEIPKVWMGLFSGANQGKLLTKIK